MEKQTEGRREVQKKIYSHQCEYHTKKNQIAVLTESKFIGTFNWNIQILE